ncbi:hypothetical protein RFI_18065 [Reticulomyxa filosa]|uniref:Uncharacterized protein n=1 Tax=Reticulomyxa filosa TaxID=46433 RepID=X6MYP5_RETFI|nr:hypothetical protein RFI_18065 [Reticulomyxa filosa]|eukprot:ETO19165.1 hypothetical protein RFI_18065 [Reticulomyxa filosa]
MQHIQCALDAGPFKSKNRAGRVNKEYNENKKNVAMKDKKISRMTNTFSHSARINIFGKQSIARIFLFSIFAIKKNAFKSVVSFYTFFMLKEDVFGKTQSVNAVLIYEKEVVFTFYIFPGLGEKKEMLKGSFNQEIKMLNNAAAAKYSTFDAVTKPAANKRKWWFGIAAIVLLALVAGAMYWNMSQPASMVHVKSELQENAFFKAKYVDMKTKAEEVAGVQQVDENAIPTLKKPKSGSTESPQKVEAKDTVSDVVEVVETVKEVAETVVEVINTAQQVATAVQDVAEGIQVVASGQTPGVADVVKTVETVKEVADTVQSVIATATQVAETVEQVEQTVEDLSDGN